MLDQNKNPNQTTMLPSFAQLTEMQRAFGADGIEFHDTSNPFQIDWRDPYPDFDPFVTPSLEDGDQWDDYTDRFHKGVLGVPPEGRASVKFGFSLVQTVPWSTLDFIRAMFQRILAPDCKLTIRPAYLTPSEFFKAKGPVIKVSYPSEEKWTKLFVPMPKITGRTTTSYNKSAQKFIHNVTLSPDKKIDACYTIEDWLLSTCALAWNATMSHKLRDSTAHRYVTTENSDTGHMTDQIVGLDWPRRGDFYPTTAGVACALSDNKVRDCMRNRLERHIFSLQDRCRETDWDEYITRDGTSNSATYSAELPQHVHDIGLARMASKHCVTAAPARWLRYATDPGKRTEAQLVARSVSNTVYRSWLGN